MDMQHLYNIYSTLSICTTLGDLILTSHVHWEWESDNEKMYAMKPFFRLEKLSLAGLKLIHHNSAGQLPIELPGSYRKIDNDEIQWHPFLLYFETGSFTKS